MRLLALGTCIAGLFAAQSAFAQTWDGRWRGRTEAPSNADVIIRISRGKPAFFSWNGASIGTTNVYVERSSARYRFSTNGGADITLLPNGRGSIRIKYWSQYLGSAEGVLYRADCQRVGGGWKCPDQ